MVRQIWKTLLLFAALTVVLIKPIVNDAQDTSVFIDQDFSRFYIIELMVLVESHGKTPKL